MCGPQSQALYPVYLNFLSPSTSGLYIPTCVWCVTVYFTRTCPTLQLFVRLASNLEHMITGPPWSQPSIIVHSKWTGSQVITRWTMEGSIMTTTPGPPLNSTYLWNHLLFGPRTFTSMFLDYPGVLLSVPLHDILNYGWPSNIIMDHCVFTSCVYLRVLLKTLWRYNQSKLYWITIVFWDYLQWCLLLS